MIKRLNNIPFGLAVGLLLPAVFIWIYLTKFYPSRENVWQIIRQLYPSAVLGKLFLLSIVPDLLVVFIFYKQDRFKIGGGIMLGGIAYLIAAIFMM